MNGFFLAFLSVQLNISPNVVKQQRPSHRSFPRKDNSFYTCTKELNSTVCEVVYNNMALSD